MSEEQWQTKNQSTTAWIVVLAISVTCCALLFILFGKYLVTIDKNLALANQQLTVMEDNETQMLHEIQAMHRSMTANAPAAAPAPAPAPAAATPPTTGAKAPPPGVAPAPASKTTVPEVPATTQ